MTPLLEIDGLHVDFGATEVVHGVGLTVMPGERVAVVGESGSGKSTTAHAIMGLLPGGGRVTSGRILLRGEDVTYAGEERLRRLRGREVGLVPQDPMSNLNPVARIGRQVAETLVVHGLAGRRDAAARAVEILGEAGLPDPGRRARQYPHEFSGGMRQRALVAIALACRPRLLVADEPTSALDVTVQQQILDRLETLTHEFGTALLLITHDLGLAADRADRVVVMSKGRVVETGPAREVLTRPQHDYTRRLVTAAPSLQTAHAIRPASADPLVLQVEGVSKSGGQRQRVAIARALALDPRLVVCDEAVSALDVLVQDQILRLLHALQDALGLSYLFISHDLAVVREIAHDIAVMRAGRVEEHGPSEQVLTAPKADYTRLLLAAVPGGAVAA
jgi:peptide/nickel transport system ATP-binding protein